jgi:hypothetical protein
MDRKIFVLSDQCIKQLADLLCLGMATNTHIGDHFRMVRLEESNQEGMESKLVLTPEYVEVYNKHVEELNKELEVMYSQLNAAKD